MTLSKPRITPEDVLKEVDGDEGDGGRASLKAQLDGQLAVEDIEDRRQDRRERKKYAVSIFALVRGWLIGVLVLLMADGCGHQQGTFDLPPTVLIAVVSGSATVIGLLSIVAAYLFSGARLQKNNDSPQVESAPLEQRSDD